MAKFKSFASSLNTERLFDIDTSEFEYVKLKDLYERDGEGTIYVIRGAYIGTKSEFVEENPILAIDDCYVNLPQHQLVAVKEMLTSWVNVIRAGGAGFMIETYDKKLKNGTKKCYKAVFVDISSDATVD